MVHGNTENFLIENLLIKKWHVAVLNVYFNKKSEPQ